MIPGLDLNALISTVGLAGIFAIVFAESGLLIGFFLPGDSLLFTAGLLASQGYFNIWLLCLGCFIAAVLGDNVGYAFGKRVGPKLFTREDSRFFHRSHIARTQHFYEKHGPKTIVLARFIPVVRTFAPILAGVGAMSYRTFLLYNVLGAALFGVAVPLAGYTLGSAIPDIERYFLPVVSLLVLTSLIPIAREWLKARRK